jgi:hypothetical protein
MDSGLIWFLGLLFDIWDEELEDEDEEEEGLEEEEN